MEVKLLKRKSSEKQTRSKLAASISRSSDKSGFTLIEALFSMVVLSIGMMGAMSLQASSLSGARYTTGLGNCTNMASNTLDRVIANQEMIAEYDGLEIKEAGGNSGSSDPVVDLDIDSIAAEMTVNGFGGGIVAINTTSNTPSSELTTVDITITWKHKGSDRTCTGQAII
ncbi:MAG: type IV pilus modification PilV family protein [Nitrospinota bacterium]